MQTPLSNQPDLHVRVGPTLKHSIQLAAEREVRSVSSFVRHAIVTQLRASGIEPLNHGVPRNGR
ncbi:MAG TPA: hypothetical protein VIE66_04345 [Methylocella sp.]